VRILNPATKQQFSSTKEFWEVKHTALCVYSLPPSAAANQADGFDIHLNQARGHGVVLIPAPVIENIHRNFRPTEKSIMDWDRFIKEHAW
jgi:hypothetical protein